MINLFLENGNFKNVKEAEMLYKYLKEYYTDGEPIFLSEIHGKSPEAVRQEIKKLVDEGKVVRVRNEIYFLMRILTIWHRADFQGILG